MTVSIQKVLAKLTQLHHNSLLKIFLKNPPYLSNFLFNRSIFQQQFSIMHELGITQNIVAIVTEHARGAPVKRVTLEIGKLSAIMPDAIQFCFDICCQGTILEGAVLEIIEIPGQGICRHCGEEVILSQPFGRCDHCGSVDVAIIKGKELQIKEMEVEELCA